MDPPPIPGSIPVFISSDNQGHFGHNCPNCGGYWRSEPTPNICPYCRSAGAGHQFLSRAQRRYVSHYCKTLIESLETESDVDVVIDMDKVADAVGRESEKPAFYVSEQSQQRKFKCVSCDGFNDILGRFGYCSRCGTRNDLTDFKDRTITSIRDRLNTGTAPEDCLRDAVSSFDSFMSQVAKQLIDLVPLTKSRKKTLTNQRFHNLEHVDLVFNNFFDINIFRGINSEKKDFVKVKFHRRHVYEHNAGEIDQKYLDDSRDTTVVLKQHIHETKQDMHQLLSILFKMARNAHKSFHELFPPITEPIDIFQQEKKRLAKLASEKPY